jgi:ParB family chromosome partitioning protein
MSNSKSQRTSILLSNLTIPVSGVNVRKRKVTNIESLSASILASGVLQNLIVIPSTEGEEKYEITAGKRRYLALCHLVDTGAITLDYRVPVLIDTSETATVASLVENFHKESMHYIDEYRSFSALNDEGLSVEEIALTVGVTKNSVIQRLALGDAAPELHEECLQGRMSIEQLKVLCQLENHEKQINVWFNTPEGWQRNPNQLRQKIRGEVIGLSHRWVKYIGLESYQENGGCLNIDLFDDKETSIANPELLSSLALSKLKMQAEKLDWAWCEVVLDGNYEYIREFKRTSVGEREMTEQESIVMDGWLDRQAELETLLESEPENGEELEAEYDEIEASIVAFNAQLLEWGDTKKIGGVYAYVDNYGQAVLIEGLVRKQDIAAIDPDAPSGVTTEKGLSGSLKEYLACARASVMQAEVIKNPRMGVILLCQSLVLEVFYSRAWSFKFLDIAYTSHSDALEKQGLEGMPSSQCVVALREKWQTRLPDESGLLEFLLGLEATEIDELLAFCSSFALKLHYANNHTNAQYAALTNLLGTDASSYWQPTADNYFKRLSKPLIIDSLSNAGVPVEDLNEDMKKKEMAALAGDRIKQNPTWLPEIIAPAKG